ncbi:MAG TPA: hypothetical protein VGB50_02845 [Flavobacterium sp.]|jgi:hypothetical protein
MISKLKKRFSQIEFKIGASHQLMEDQLALTQLLKMFDDKVFFPLTAWSISPKEVLHICNDIIINDRKSIVEFGSGFSTICIANLLKIKNKHASFVSIENNQLWAAELTKILESEGLSNYVSIKVAPISDVPSKYAYEKQQKWYDHKLVDSAIDGNQNIDLVIVDGPYGRTTPYARYTAVPFLKEKLGSDYAIFLDDTARDHEKQIASEWHKLLGGQMYDHNRYTYLTNLRGFDVSPFGN